MAVVKLHDDIYLATGTATKDADFKLLGDKQTPKTSFSLAAGKRADTTTIFVNGIAWRELAKYAKHICKGDAVAIIGKLEKREYNGKEYTDLNAEWINIVGISSNTEISPSGVPYPQGITFDEDKGNNEPLPWD